MRRALTLNRAFAAGTTLGSGLVAAGYVLVITRDTGAGLLVAGFLLLVGGLAGVHTILGRRYGGLGLIAFLLTQASLFLIVLGIGFVTLAAAAPLLAFALVRMQPPLRLSAALLVAVWPLSVAAGLVSELGVFDALAVLFPLPYGALAVEALRLPE